MTAPAIPTDAATESIRALMRWRPHDPHEWARQVAGLPLAARGALHAIADALWLSTDGPCAIRNDERTIAAAAGARLEWEDDATLRRAVLSVLEPHPELDGYLTWPWLLDTWCEQRDKHLARRAAGAKGGRSRRRAIDAAQVPLPIVEPVEVSEPAPVRKHGLALLSNARQSKRERTASLRSAEREAVPLTSREPAPCAAAPPAAVASAARGAAPALVHDPAPPPLDPTPPLAVPLAVHGRGAVFDAEAARAAREREQREAEERAYYAAKREGSTPTAAVDWRTALRPPRAREAIA